MKGVTSRLGLRAELSRTKDMHSQLSLSTDIVYIPFKVSSNFLGGSVRRSFRYGLCISNQDKGGP